MTRKINKTGRSHGEARHVRLYHWLQDSAAWSSLDANARSTYLELARRYAGPGSNNGRIPYSVREIACCLNIGKGTASRAFQKLTDRGFIVPMRKGAFSLKLRHATEWRLTEFPCDVKGTPATKDFMRWQPGQVSSLAMGSSHERAA